MSVWITGDIHGNPARLSTNNFYEQKEFSGDKDENIVIILGDFGLVWSRDRENKNEKYWDDAYDIEYTSCDEITYTDRFPKPEWIK